MIFLQDTKVPEALEHYSNGLKMLIPAYQPPTELNDAVLLLKQSFYLNISACQLKSERFEYAAKNCTKALEIDPENVKALYRRSIAFTELNELENAKKDIEMGLKIDSDNIALKNHLQQIEIKVKEQDKKMGKVMKSFLAEQTAERDGDKDTIVEKEDLPEKEDLESN